MNPRNILAVADVDIAPGLMNFTIIAILLNDYFFLNCKHKHKNLEEFLKCLEMPGIPKIDVINLVGALADVEKTRNELVARGGLFPNNNLCFLFCYG